MIVLLLPELCHPQLVSSAVGQEDLMCMLDMTRAFINNP